jgi:hypothetical protein
MEDCATARVAMRQNDIGPYFAYSHVYCCATYPILALNLARFTMRFAKDIGLFEIEPQFVRYGVIPCGSLGQTSITQGEVYAYRTSRPDV